MKYLPTLFVVIIIAIVITTRFVNIAWGQPYFFHPDERNIAASISQLAFPSNFYPDFFAYGSLPIYLVFFTGLLINFFSLCNLNLSSCQVSFDQAIVLSRLFSAIFSCLSLFVLYKVAGQLWNKQSSLIVLLLGVFCTGFIQFSHFGTYEMWSVFFSLLLCYISLCFLKKPSLLHALGIGSTTGILISLKLSNLVFLPLALCSLIFAYHTLRKESFLATLRILSKYTVLILLVTCIIYFVTNPFVLLTPTEFMNSFRYERTVATGELPVFYTQEFFQTIPVLYQFIRVLPFLINPFMTLLLPIMIIVTALHLYKTKKVSYALVLLFFLISFLPQAILFIKWTRNSVITIPYILLLFPALFVFIKKTFIKQVFAGITIIISMIFSLSYFSLVYVQPDSRVEAANAARKSIPETAEIMSEVYDMGIVPFNAYFHNITLVNTYDMEHDPILLDEFKQTERNSRYIILPSKRVLKTRMYNHSRFPQGSEFYTKLLSNQNYKKIYETPCTLLCKIVYLGDPLHFETTASVFDRPIVQVYKKI